MRGVIGFGAALALVLAFASAALAGPRDDQYGNEVTKATTTQSAVAGVASATASKKSPTVASAAAGALPFTGLQLGVAVVAGVGLVGAGLAVRRMGRTRRNSS
ncbi:MAG TPA: hypothetical protein VFB26_02745 [Gaiellaceae bacterium]|nr:hypothetical protein [Gaiellaceae bacterium]